MTSFGSFPSGDPPAVDAVVAAITAGFPADARARATALLRDRILPWSLRSLATHPKPRRLAEVVYEDLTDRLTRVAPSDRLVELERVDCEVTADRFVGEATSLAVARYLLDHPQATGGAPWRDAAARWRGQSTALLATEAERRTAELASFQQRAAAECGRAIGQKLLHAKLALGSAGSGSFATAAGMLHDFLREVGEEPRELDVH